MADCLYTLHWIDSGIVIQSGQVPRPELYPPIPDGAMITEGVEANPETERIEKGKIVVWKRPLVHEELLAVIERERNRRLTSGFIYDFKDERGKHHIGTTLEDDTGWDKVTKLANACVLAGNPNAEINIETNTGPVKITAMEWQKILIRRGAFEQPLFDISFRLQKLEPIPQDVDKPEYWDE
jgi:hypothetical protein